MTIYALPMDTDSTSLLPAFTGSQNRVADAVLLAGGSAARPLGARSGWRPGAGPQVSISGVTATIQPLAGVIDTAANATSGPFRFVSDAVITRTITTALQGVTRSDILYAQVSDQPTDGSGLRQGDIVYLAGPSGGAVPATPARSLRLGVINVPVSGGGTPTFTPDPVYSVAAGGVLPLPAGTRPASPYVGQYIDDAAAGLLRWDGSVWRQQASGKFFTNITLDANGFATVAHGLGWTPTSVVVTPSSPISAGAANAIFAMAMTDTYTSTTFRVRGLFANAGAITGSVNFSAMFG